MTEIYDSKLQVVPAGDAAALVVLGDEMTVEMSGRVHALARTLGETRPPGVRDLVPAYCTLLIHFDPAVLSFDGVKALVERANPRGFGGATSEPRLREIPTLYGGNYGPDLPTVAEQLRIPEEQIVRLHSSATYVVCTLGFAPGHPYVVGLPPQLALPRRQSPRPLVPAGSVTLANQTNVYPMPNPTGWWWIGRTPIRLFDPSSDPPTFLQPGDRMHFIPIDEEEYLRLGGEKQ